MKKTVRFGIAGWQYPDWEGIVYPKKKPKGFEPLLLIASMLDAVEVNASYYGPFSVNSSRKWVRIVQPFPEFRFSAKLWQRFTHAKESWGDQEVLIFQRGLDPLLDAGRLGCILCQFPWSFRESEDNFARLKKIAHDFKKFPLMVELRHQSWKKDWFLDWLRENAVGFANIDQPLFHDSMPRTEISTSQLGYARLHGRNYQTWFKQDAESWERYDYLYSEQELVEWIPRLQKIAQNSEQLFVIANNHFQGKGVAGALMLKFMWTKKKQAAPKSLLQKYPELKPFCEPVEAQKELF